MTAIIRQQFIDPVSAQRQVRELSIEIESVRPDETNELGSVIYMKAIPVPVQPHLQHDTPNFTPIFVCPEELLSIIIDGKRTHTPLGCHRTRLTQELKDHWHLYVEDTTRSGLDAKIGDPVVVLSNLTENNKRIYGLVSEVHSDQHVELTVSNKDCPCFLKGAFVQNLANQWTKSLGIVGAKSQLSRAPHPTFAVSRQNPNSVRVIIQIPLDNSNQLQYYDVYVRSTPFTQIEPHWVPDVQDITVESAELTVDTFNGGPDAGGGMLNEKQQKLFAVVISKDRLGHNNVNESECFAKAIP